MFVDFVSKCLSWDPERRLKPQSALRHPFITAGRKAKIINNTSPPARERGHLSSSSLLGVGRAKPTETPKKSQISAPTPLAARSSRVTTNTVPTTPSSSSVHTAALGSTSKSYRASQGLSTYHSSSRTLNGIVVSSSVRIFILLYL